MSPADRLTPLPNDIIRIILVAADLDLKPLAQTSILSSQWRSLWKSSITKLDFNNIPLAVDEWNTFSHFVEQVLSYRNDSDYRNDLRSLSLTTNGMLRPHMSRLLEMIFHHGVECRVESFRFAVGLDRTLDSIPTGLPALLGSVENLELSFRGDIFEMLKPGDGPTTNFSALRRLRLSRCVLARPALGMSYPIPQVPFEHIPNLNKLELIECHFRSLYPVKISGDELVDLVIVCPREGNHYPLLTQLMICAPRLKSFTCKEIRLLRISIVELESLEFLDIDIVLDSLICYPPRKEEEASLEVFRFFLCLPGVKRMKLHPSTITALIMFPSLLEQAESPFKRMDCVEFHNGDYLISNRRIFNALLSYFFNDHVGGTDLFDRFFPRPDASDDSSPKSVVVYKSDLP